MRCLACDCNMSDKEANRKFLNFEQIANPEERYIMLCDGCIQDSELAFIENPTDDELPPENE